MRAVSAWRNAGAGDEPVTEMTNSQTPSPPHLPAPPRPTARSSNAAASCDHASTAAVVRGRARTCLLRRLLSPLTSVARVASLAPRPVVPSALVVCHARQQAAWRTLAVACGGGAEQEQRNAERLRPGAAHRIAQFDACLRRGTPCHACCDAQVRGGTSAWGPGGPCPGSRWAGVRARLPHRHGASSGEEEEVSGESVCPKGVRERGGRESDVISQAGRSFARVADVLRRVGSECDSVPAAKKGFGAAKVADVKKCAPASHSCAPCFPFARCPDLRLRTVHREPALLNVDATAQLAFYKVWVRAGDDAAWRAFGETVVAKEDDIALALKERRSFMRGAASSSAFPISCRVEHRRGTVSWWCSGALQLRAVGVEFSSPGNGVAAQGRLEPSAVWRARAGVRSVPTAPTSLARSHAKSRFGLGTLATTAEESSRVRRCAA